MRVGAKPETVNSFGRFWLAAALAPLSVPALFVLKSLYSGSGFESPFVAHLAAIAAVSYVGFLVFGLPFVLLLRARGNLSYAAILLGGVVAGPLFFVFTQLWSREPVILQGDYARVAIVYTGLSVTVAMAFALIARARIS